MPRTPSVPVAWAGANVLVTGASGFIGGHLAKYLADRGANVFAVCSPGQLLETSSGNQYRWFDVELRDAVAVQSLVQSVQPVAVFHLGAVVNLERVAAVARVCLEVNILGTLNMLEALRDSDVASVVFSSTTEVYGQNTPPFHEDQAPCPPSPYAISKLAAEHLCRLAWQIHELPVVVARLAATYGPGQAPHRLVATLIRAALRQEAVEIGHASQERDWLYVTDAVEGLVALARCPQAFGAIVNLGSLQRVSHRMLGELIGQLAGLPMPVRYDESPRRIGEAAVWSTDASRAKAWCGWQPHYSLEDGLQETIRWHQARMGLQQPITI